MAGVAAQGNAQWSDNVSRDDRNTSNFGIVVGEGCKVRRIQNKERDHGG